MARLSFQNVGISGMAAAVPSRVIRNLDPNPWFPEGDVKEVVEKIGVKERRFADDQTCASDLCYGAAEKLLSDMEVDRSEIDLLIFISQTPDYRMPATSILLQERLGCSRDTIAFDINLGCSAFIYGLSVAYSMMAGGQIRKALILDGETRSRVYSPKDRKTAFLFGDAGAAALIERDERFGDSYFSMNSDGERSSLIQIKGGGYRHMSSEETLREKVVDEYGNIRSDEHGYMNGADVFNFVIREVPRDVKALLAFAGRELSSPDYYVFHQANSFINGFLAKKMKLPAEKIPSTLEEFGNTSSVSIPLTIVRELREELKERKALMMSGFGVGLSWATALLQVDDCRISPLVEI